MSRSRRAKGKIGGAHRSSMWAKENMIADGRINRANSCLAKSAYTLREAVDAKGKLRGKRHKVNIYHCRFCAKYHLTSFGA